MPEINDEKIDVTHYFISISPNIVVEYGRGLVATRPILDGEPLALATTKGVPIEDFLIGTGFLRELAKCDIESKDSVTTAVNESKEYSTYVKTVIEKPSCSTRQI